MTARYYVSQPIQGNSAQITGPEAHHLLHVMRGKPGDQVKLFDGTGNEYLAQITLLSRRDVELTVLTRATVSRESSRQVTLAVALPKGDRQSWLVEKAVELGVARLIPLVTERSQAKITDSVLDRLRRTVIEASKQCERNVLMEIAAPTSWQEFSARPADGLRLIAIPGATEPLHLVSLGTEVPVLAAIGPEGDWSPQEIAAAKTSGWRPISLGPRILRVETAAILTAGLLIGATSPPDAPPLTSLP
jgi:16S rRNA (uracil1498-N3)-methyltransferase